MRPAPSSQALTPAAWVLLALIAGGLMGFLVRDAASPVAAAVTGMAATVGTLFVNLIRLTVVPLVASTLVATAASIPTSTGLRRIGTRAAVLGVLVLTLAALGTMVAVVPMLARLNLDLAAARELSAPASAPATNATTAAPSLASWLLEFVPQNIVAAAAEGAMLPLILATLLFGVALGRVDGARRDAVLRLVEGIRDAMHVLVSWVVRLAPLGVFALALSLTARLGSSGAVAVVGYVGLVVALTVVGIALLCIFGMLAGRMPVSAFLAYVTPAQVIGFSSRSSLAALPVMIASAEQARLCTGARLVLPLALTVFHVGAVIAQTTGVLFLAQLYGTPLSTWQLASVAAAIVAGSLAVPGVPGGSILAAVPAMSAAGLPLDGLGVLLAVDAVPDMFRTTANVTGALALVAALHHDDQATADR